LKFDNDTNQEIGDNEGEDPAESRLWSDSNENTFDYQPEVLRLGLAQLGKQLQTTKAPQVTKISRADSDIAHPLLGSSRNPAGAMAPPLLKHKQ
jgi:hypothetical protein